VPIASRASVITSSTASVPRRNERGFIHGERHAIEIDAQLNDLRFLRQRLRHSAPRDDPTTAAAKNSSDWMTMKRPRPSRFKHSRIVVVCSTDERVTHSVTMLHTEMAGLGNRLIISQVVRSSPAGQVTRRSRFPIEAGFPARSGSFTCE
jgi:hypothetical protein